MAKAPRLKSHILICGWSDRGRLIIEQLHAEDLAKMRHIVIIDEYIDYCPVDDPYVSFIKGDPTENAILKKACTEDAHTAIILTDWTLPNSNLRDSKTALITLAIESINSDIYTVAEVMRPESKRHLDRAGVDEPICVSELSQKILVMAALNHGLSRLFNNLFTFDSSSEIYCTPVPQAYIGLDFQSLMLAIHRKQQAILIGAVRGKDIYVNPTEDFRFEYLDRIFIISKRYPDWISDIERSVTSESNE